MAQLRMAIDRLKLLLLFILKNFVSTTLFISNYDSQNDSIFYEMDSQKKCCHTKKYTYVFDDSYRQTNKRYKHASKQTNSPIVWMFDIQTKSVIICNSFTVPYWINQNEMNVYNFNVKAIYEAKSFSSIFFFFFFRRQCGRRRSLWMKEPQFKLDNESEIFLTQAFALQANTLHAQCLMHISFSCSFWCDVFASNVRSSSFHFQLSSKWAINQAKMIREPD